MTDRTAETQIEVIKSEMNRDLNRIQAIMMLTTDGFFNSRELLALQPKIQSMFKDIEEGIAKL